MNKIVQNHKGQHVAVVTHGYVLGSLITHLGHEVNKLPELSNESITTFTWHEDRQVFIFDSIEHA